MNRRACFREVLLLWGCALALAWVPAAHASDSSLVLSEGFLNRLLGRVGVMSDGGVTLPYRMAGKSPKRQEVCEFYGHFDCPEFAGSLNLGMSPGRIPIVICKDIVASEVELLPVGDPIPWQWWIKDAAFDLVAGGMSFAATVVTNVGGDWSETTRSVPARVELHNQRLRVVIDEFAVLLENQSSAWSVDLDPVHPNRYYGISIPTALLPLHVPGVAGETTIVRPVVDSAVPIYLDNELRVQIDVDF